MNKDNVINGNTTQIKIGENFYEVSYPEGAIGWLSKKYDGINNLLSKFGDKSLNSEQVKEFLYDFLYAGLLHLKHKGQEIPERDNFFPWDLSLGYVTKILPDLLEQWRYDMGASSKKKA